MVVFCSRVVWTPGFSGRLCATLSLLSKAEVDRSSEIAISLARGTKPPALTTGHPARLRSARGWVPETLGETARIRSTAADQ